MFSARDFGLTVKGQAAGGEELCLCPWHSDHKPSAWFNKKTGLFYCSVCNRGANWRQLAKEFGVKGGGWNGKDVYNPYVGDLEETEFVLELFDEIEEGRLYGVKKSHSYLTNRGVENWVAEYYGLEVARDEQGEYILFPVCDLGGNRIGALFRNTKAYEALRYKKLGKITPLWPLPELKRAKQGEQIIVVEGAFSALRIKGALPTSKVFSLFGARVPKGLLELVSPFDPIFIYDDDFAGRMAGKKLQTMNASLPIYFWNPSPDDLDDREITSKLLTTLALASV